MTALFLLAFTPPAGAAPELTGVLGLQWGATIEQVQQTMRQNGCPFFGQVKMGGEHIIQTFENISYGGCNGLVAAAFFKHNSLFEVSVVIKNKDCDPDDVYGRLMAFLRNMYGPPVKEEQFWANNDPSTGVKGTRAIWRLANPGSIKHEIRLGFVPDFYVGQTLIEGSVGVSFTNHGLEYQLRLQDIK